MKNNIKNIIKNNKTIKQALKTLDSTAEKIILVVNENADFLGTLTDGDIRRALLKGASLETSIKTIFNKSFIYLNEDEFTKEKAIEMCKENKIIGLPILNNNLIASYSIEREVTREMYTLISQQILMSAEIIMRKTNKLGNASKG